MTDPDTHAPQDAADLAAQVALLQDQLQAVQALLEQEARARIALEQLIQARSDP
ncbi:MAG: hypothetical protein AAFN94_00500 [Pseudomonadota bacterium]